MSALGIVCVVSTGWENRLGHSQWHSNLKRRFFHPRNAGDLLYVHTSTSCLHRQAHEHSQQRSNMLLCQRLDQGTCKSTAAAGCPKLICDGSGVVATQGVLSNLEIQRGPLLDWQVFVRDILAFLFLRLAGLPVVLLSPSRLSVLMRFCCAFTHIVALSLATRAS